MSLKNCTTNALRVSVQNGMASSTTHTCPLHNFFHADVALMGHTKILIKNKDFLGPMGTTSSFKKMCRRRVRLAFFIEGRIKYKIEILNPQHNSRAFVY